MEIKFNITFKRGTQTVATVQGLPVNAEQVSVAEAGEKVIDTEQFLEKLTGLRVHIQQAE